MPVNPHQAAQRLRREQTDAERLLWSRIRAGQLNGLKFRRQFPIGHFIVDFCCRQRRLVVELDGGQHDLQRERDRRREMLLSERSYRVLRFWNDEVLKNIDGVLQRILEAL